MNKKKVLPLRQKQKYFQPDLFSLSLNIKEHSIASYFLVKIHFHTHSFQFSTKGKTFEFLNKIKYLPSLFLCSHLEYPLIKVESLTLILFTN